MDIIGRFINECCWVNDKLSITSSRLYEKYTKWTEENGEYTLSNLKFINKLKEKGFSTKQGHARKTFIHGIDLNNDLNNQSGE